MGDIRDTLNYIDNIMRRHAKGELSDWDALAAIKFAIAQDEIKQWAKQPEANSGAKKP